MSELARYHRQIEKKYKNHKPDDIKVNPDVTALIAFNGYYALDTATGAFFAIDTNIHIKDESPTPIKDVCLIVSLDGITSSRFDFTGTFDGTRLNQVSPLDGFDVDLTFEHTNASDGSTAKCSGSISFQSKKAPNVSGITYNNPIRSPLFNGTYIGSVPLYINGTTENVTAPVLQINGYQLLYDYGINGGALQPVPTYSYNMNMYYFSFKQGTDTVSFIMGTAAAKGFACNNMVVDKTNKVSSRSLTTIPKPKQTKLVFPNLSSKDLAAFSGYYQIPSIHPLAFVSIQAEYMNIIGDDYIVQISVSLDGVTSNGYYFEEEKMTFANNVLTMPDQSISIAFERVYEAENKSLVTITATFGTSYQNVKGNTLFNPVPLSAFSGVMTNSDGDQLAVGNDNGVIWNGNTLEDIIYVPLMYILAYPIKATSLVMSFGTNGCKGNTCIVTDLSKKPMKICVVSAIPNAAC